MNDLASRMQRLADTALAPLPTLDDLRRRNLRRHHQKRVLGGLGAGALLLAAVLVIALAIVPGSPKGRVVSPPGTSQIRPHWNLVADVASQWSLQPVEGWDFYLTCPSVGVCYAEAEAPGGSRSMLEVTTDGGAQWVRYPMPDPLDPPFTCLSATVCAGVGVHKGQAVFEETMDGGTSWQVEPLHADLPGVMSCTTPASCVAIAGSSGSVMALVTTDGGVSWTSYALPAAVTSAPASLQCFASGECLALGNSVGPTGTETTIGIYSTDGGTSWSTSQLPPSFAFGWDISCTSSTACMVTGTVRGGSAVAVSSDGGQVWTLANTPLASTGAVTLNWLACAGEATCFVSGIPFSGGESGVPSAFVAGTSDAGSTWQVSHLPAGVDAIGTVSCPTSTACYGFGAKSLPSGMGSPVFLSTTG